MTMFWHVKNMTAPGQRPHVHRRCGLTFRAVLCRRHTSMPNKVRAAVFVSPVLTCIHLM